ncbi:unnamed protein product [Boreogadus saida]
MPSWYKGMKYLFSYLMLTYGGSQWRGDHKDSLRAASQSTLRRRERSQAHREQVDGGEEERTPQPPIPRPIALYPQPPRSLSPAPLPPIPRPIALYPQPPRSLSPTPQVPIPSPRAHKPSIPNPPGLYPPAPQLSILSPAA